MSRKSNVMVRVGLFGLVACLLLWLGTLKPKIAATGPSMVVVHQGSNLSFEPQNAQASTWHVSSSGALTNASLRATNGIGQ